MNAEKQEEYRGYTILFFTDEWPQDPRTEWDNFGDMVAYHRDYTLGDYGHKREDRWSREDAHARLVELAQGAGATIPEREDTDAYEDTEAAVKYLAEHGVCLPLFLLDHSGITMSTGRYGCDPQGWDTSTVGYIVATPAMIRQEYGRNTKATREKAAKRMRAEVETYASYLEGDVVGWSVERDGDTVEQVGGYYGFSENEKDMLAEARAAVDADIKERMRKHCERRKVEIRQHVPLGKRAAFAG